MSEASQKNERKKNKLVRDSFTIPKGEYAAIDALKTRAIALGTSVKKSELLRAGLLALQGMADASFKEAIAAVPQLKTGRPAAAAAPDPAPAPAPSPTPRAAAKKAAARPAAAAKRTVRQPAKAPATAADAAPAAAAAPAARRRKPAA